jgi:hypothetical protein
VESKVSRSEKGEKKIPVGVKIYQDLKIASWRIIVVLSVVLRWDEEYRVG